MDDLKVIVEGHGQYAGYKAKLGMNCIICSSFYLQWEKNATYQLQFTAKDDKLTGYDLLTPEASIYFQGQEFLIKQITPDYNAGFNTKAVLATHVSTECQWFRKREVKEGVLTYKPQDVMSYIFDGNEQGITWEVIGDFSSNQIENLGNMSGQEAITKIIETWPDAIIFPNNRHICIYQHDSFVKNRGHRLGYMHNVTEIKPQYDSTNVTNKVWCVGKQKDKADGADPNGPPEYFFPPFVVSDETSITKWTHGKPHWMADINDERFTDANDMRQYAIKQLSTEPALSIDVTTIIHGQPIPGDIVKTEVREENLEIDAEIVSYQWYPFDSSQPTQITLNNTAKTIFDYQNNLRNKVYKDMLSRITLVNSSMSYLKDQNKINSQDIKDLGNRIDNLQPKDWTAGGVFIDTSSNNGMISVDNMKDYQSKGVKGIICKLTEGTGYVNPLFDNHKVNATNAGLKFIGAYHFFHGDAVNEANYFLKQLQAKNVSKDTLVICDIEASDLSGNKEVLTNQVKQFYQILIDSGYINTCDYTSASWLNNRFNQVGKYSWIASYGASNPPNGINAWQFTDNWNGLKIDASYSYNPIFV